MIEKVLQSIFRSDMDTRYKIYNIVTLLGTAFCLLITVFLGVMGNAIGAWICGGMTVISVITVLYAYRTSDYQNSNTVVVILVFMMGFTMMFFQQGGVNGPSFSFFTFAIGYTAFCIEGRRAFILIALEILVYSIDISISVAFPQYVTGAPESVIAIIIPVMGASAVLALTVSLQLRLYLEQQTELREINEKYKQLYRHDELTGLWNRYGLKEQIEQKKLNRGNVDYTVMIFDIDFFKRVNDTYGHSVGDAVLKQMADTVKDLIGRQGGVCRWGGEEFVVFLPETVGAEELAEEIRRTVEEMEIHADRLILKVTISIGVAIYHNHPMNLDDLAGDADRELYKAKEQGRNRISVVRV